MTQRRHLTLITTDSRGATMHTTRHTTRHALTRDQVRWLSLTLIYGLFALSLFVSGTAQILAWVGAAIAAWAGMTNESSWECACGRH